MTPIIREIKILTPIIREIKILESVHGSDPKKHPHDPTRILLALNSAHAQKRERESLIILSNTIVHSLGLHQ